jgi:hypothetical protein
VAEIWAVIEPNVLRVKVEALLDVLASAILKLPAPRVIVPLPIYLLAEL